MEDIRCVGLWELAMEQGAPPQLGARLTACPAAQEPDVVLAIDVAHNELILASKTNPWACRVPTRERSTVGAFQEVLREHSGLLSHGLHTT